MPVIGIVIVHGSEHEFIEADLLNALISNKDNQEMKKINS
jgi:hypothetical protein